MGNLLVYSRGFSCIFFVYMQAAHVAMHMKTVETVLQMKPDWMFCLKINHLTHFLSDLTYVTADA